MGSFSFGSGNAAQLVRLPLHLPAVTPSAATGAPASTPPQVAGPGEDGVRADGDELVSQGDDPNHFAPNYFGTGFKWQLPDLKGSERAYRMARQAYEAAGRSVVDATVGGKLTVFPKVDFNSLF